MTPTPGDVVLSGAFYVDPPVYALPAYSVDINVYEVNAAAVRLGAAVTTTVTDAAGTFSITLPPGRMFEFELTAFPFGFPFTYHYYLPQTTTDVSGIKLLFGAGLPMPVDLSLGIVYLCTNGVMIQPADIIRIDSGANINDPILNDGFSDNNLFFSSPFPDSYYFKNETITASVAPGTAHTVTYKSATRMIRVQPGLTYHVSLAVFY